MVDKPKWWWLPSKKRAWEKEQASQNGLFFEDDLRSTNPALKRSSRGIYSTSSDISYTSPIGSGVCSSGSSTSCSSGGDGGGGGGE